MKELNTIVRSNDNRYFRTPDNSISFPLNLNELDYMTPIDLEHGRYAERVEYGEYEECDYPNINTLINQGKLIECHYSEEYRVSTNKFPCRCPYNKVLKEFKKNGFVFLIVDGAKEAIPGSAGYYRDDTLKWLDEKLTKNEKKSVIIFQHFPVVYPDGVDSKLKTHKTYRVEDYKDVLVKHNNVLAIITGHFHTNSETIPLSNIDNNNNYVPPVITFQ